MAGHDLRLNSNTEKTMPKPRPSVDFIRRLERQRSHCGWCVSTSCARLCWAARSAVVRPGRNQGDRTFSFRSASLTGREMVLGGGGGTDVSAILDISATL